MSPHFLFSSKETQSSFFPPLETCFIAIPALLLAHQLALSQDKPGGKRVANRSWHSLALLADDSVVVSPSDDNSLFSTFKSPGGPVKRIGPKKEFAVKGTAQNEFFNQGLIAVNQVDNTIYYVFTHALIPTVQLFNKQGELLSEFQVQGAAIDLQTGLTKQILQAKAAKNCAGDGPLWDPPRRKLSQ